ncbi:MAG TPA: DedA family protein [Methylomirabilota bacterium]|nr:DedA family protein [Methylomirabilota bacterium]
MTDPTRFINYWGYLAIFFIVTFGNAGVPVPEETALGVAGYMVWRGQLWLPAVLVVGVVSAVVGDNLGYWVGRRFGRGALLRYARWVLGHPERLERMQAFIARRGPLAVFLARFVPGLRAMAGPLAGASGLPFAPFFAANVLGAVIYVPLAVAAGYAVGYGLGGYVERLRAMVGELERLVWAAALGIGILVVGWHVLQALRVRRR